MFSSDLTQRSEERRKIDGTRRGTAAVELGLTLPIIMFTFLVGVDYCRAFYYSQVIQNCARNGAMYAADPKSAANNLYTNVQAAALADAPGLSPQPSVTSTTGKDSSGNAYVQVTVTWQFNTLSHFPGIIGQTLTRTVQMRSIQ